MKTLLLILLLPSALFAQSLSVGVSYGPFASFAPNAKIVKPSLSPSVDVVFGIDGFKGYASLGNTIQLGIRTGNYGLFAGMGFMYNPYEETNANKVYFFEFGYEKEVKKDITVFVSTKHGFTFKETKYFGCPLSIGVNYKLTK